VKGESYRLKEKRRAGLFGQARTSEEGSKAATDGGADAGDVV